ncbi:MAG: hypothetical protein BGO33_05790 [Bacteroidia bacterium 43-41]|nr:MAG: hypothetical protein BGO33_05790 [Bacteroidia bacterium 43-41]
MRKYILITALLVSAGIFAQQRDSLLRRQMELEREFNPTLQDANKINSLPSVPQPTIKKANTGYSPWAGRTTPPLEIAIPKPTDIMTGIPFSLKKGYISLGAGNYANIDGALGYRLIENEKSDLSFNFLHNSSNGDVSYVQDSDPASNKAFFMDNMGQLRYGHLLDAFKLNLKAAYSYSAFNYYGNTFGNKRVFNNENQTLNVFNLGLGVESNKSDVVNYRGFLDFKNFSTKYGEILSDAGLKGNHLDAMVGLDKPFQGSDSRVGIDGTFGGVFYNGEMDDFMLLSANPYIAFEGLNWKARLGADLLIQMLGGTKFRVVPNVELELNVTGHSSLYAQIKGGIDDNTYLDMMNESRYLSPMTSVKSSFSIVDIEAGAKIGEVSGFRFDIFGGFRKTDDEHFLVLNQLLPEGTSETDKETLAPVYGNLSHTHIGGMIQSNIWSPLDIALRVKKNIYTVSDTGIPDAKAYNKPGLETDIRATFSAMSNLKFTLNYYFAGDRWSYFDRVTVKMNNINDLNLGAVYDINDSFALNLKANNLLLQKYDIWYGYPAQGFNAMGGFTFKF